MENLNNKLIFSVERTENSKEVNDLNTYKVSRFLVYFGVNYTKATGVYEGIEEVSFVIDTNRYHENLVSMICFKYNQECFLAIEVAGGSYLYYPDDRSQFIGTMKEGKPSEGEAYTLVEGKYFHVI